MGTNSILLNLQYKILDDASSTERLERSAQLKVAQTWYQYDNSLGFPVNGTPRNKIGGPGPRDISGVGWVRQLVDAGIRIRHNFIDYSKKANYKFEKNFPKSVIDKNMINWVKDALKPDLDAQMSSGAKFAQFFIPDWGRATPNPGHKRTLDDYKEMFQNQAIPEIAEDFESDESFAYTFVAGPSPAMVQQMTQKTSKFPLNNNHFKRGPFSNDDLDQAIAEGRIFWVDYAAMKDLKNGISYDAVQKYIYAPIVAFGIPQGGDRLVPIGIQCGQSPEGRTIFTPDDGNAWKIAKNCVLAAHNTYHEVLSHLGFTHLFMEVIMLATRRQLSYGHPVYSLLDHHFEGTGLINNAAVHGLILPKRAVDRLIGSDLPSTYEMLRKERLAYSFKDNYLPRRLARFATGAESKLGVYPYRDDGLLVWNAIANWTKNFVGYYYKNDQRVRGDKELAAWAKEIVAIGQVKDFPETIGTMDELSDVLTMIIFTSSAQHAAVNFSQLSDTAWVPANPLAGYGPEPVATKQYTRQDWLDHLPPMEVAVVAVSMLTLLASIHHTTLGEYDLKKPEEHILHDFYQDGINQEVAKFREALANIENTIKDRNMDRSKRMRPYIHLLPSLIPQSINI